MNVLMDDEQEFLDVHFTGKNNSCTINTYQAQ